MLVAVVGLDVDELSATSGPNLLRVLMYMLLTSYKLCSAAAVVGCQVHAWLAAVDRYSRKDGSQIQRRSTTPFGKILTTLPLVSLLLLVKLG